MFFSAYQSLKVGQTVGYAYHEAVLGHKPPPNAGREYPETPERIRAAFSKFKEFKLDQRCFPVTVRLNVIKRY